MCVRRWTSEHAYSVALGSGPANAGHYRKQWLVHDALAGLALSAVLVPVGMGYAQASGVDPIYGLYATIIPLLVYALFGPSRILVLGPDSTLAAVIAAVILPLSAGAPERAAPWPPCSRTSGRGVFAADRPGASRHAGGPAVQTDPHRFSQCDCRHRLGGANAQSAGVQRRGREPAKQGNGNCFQGTGWPGQHRRSGPGRRQPGDHSGVQTLAPQMAHAAGGRGRHDPDFMGFGPAPHRRICRCWGYCHKVCPNFS